MATGFVPDATPAPGFVPDGTATPVPPAGGTFQPNPTLPSVPVTHPGFVADGAHPTPTAGPAPAAPPKKPFWSALTKPIATPVAHVIADTEDSIRRNWQWARAHPTDTVFSAVALGQRAVGNIVGGIEQHPNDAAALLAVPGGTTAPPHPTSARLQGGLQSLAQDIFHPGDLINGRDATARDTESIRALVHAPTHEAIDEFVTAHVPAELRPYAAAVLKGGEDFGLQAGSDPTSYFDGLGVGVRAAKMLPALKAALKGAEAAKALTALAHASGAAKLFPWLPKIASSYGEMTENIGKGLNKMFKPRAALDTIVTADGRRPVLQIENRNRQMAKEDARTDATALAAPGMPGALHPAAQRYLQYLHNTATTIEEQTELARLGSNLPISATKVGFDPSVAVQKGMAAMRAAGKVPSPADIAGFATKAKATYTANLAKRFQNGLAAFGAGSPEEQALQLAKLRVGLQNSRTARETVEHLNTNGGWKPGVQMTANDFGKFIAKNSQSLEETLQTSPIGRTAVAAMSIPRGLMQAALFLNPLPHGIKNVGQLAWLAEGFPGVFRAVKHMAGAVAGQGVPQTLRDRLAKIGASPNIGDGLRETVWSKIPGWNQAAGALQDAMGHMEMSWRAGMLETLDKRLGPSKNEAEELMKGYIVNDRLGDYHNQSAFVQAFTLIGGPWVAFRLGIIPRNIMTALAEHPARFLAPSRAQVDLNRNRSAKGQADNELEFGGPVGDSAKAAIDPVGYLTSPATTGLIGKAGQAISQAGSQPASSVAGSFAESFDPTEEVRGVVSHAIGGTGMPAPNGPHGKERFQPESLTDKLIGATLESLALYYHKNQSKAALQKQASEDRALKHKEFQKVQGALGGPSEQAKPSGFIPNPR